MTAHEYDAVLLPGGGLKDDGALHPWSRARLDAAAEIRGEKTILISLSRGTVHKAPPQNEFGFPIDESRAAADYLLGRGVPPQRILRESVSLDTIGNAFFARVLHTDPLGLRRLLVITSEFHMPRTRRIFEWVFGLDYDIAAPGPGDGPYRLDFQETPNTDIPESVLRARLEKEQTAMNALGEFMKGIEYMENLHEAIHSRHDAYAAGREPERVTATDIAESY